MNISYIKEELIDYLDTPLPYIIGVREDLWEKVNVNKWNEVSDDTVAFNVDNCILYTKVEVPTPPAPIT